MDTKKVGNAISYLRKRAGYTQKDLADRIGISDKAVSKWERGIGLPDISYLSKLSILLDTDTDSLLSGDVIHHDKGWQGVLILEESPCGIGADTIIFDKPLISYLLSYFLLVGIKKVLVVCPEKDKAYIKSSLGDGSKLGICLFVFCAPIQTALLESQIDCDNLMIVYGRSLIYGVDQTRFFRKAMVHKDRLTILALPKKGSYLARKLAIDENRKVAGHNGGKTLRTQYDYCDIPILFCPKNILEQMAASQNIHTFLFHYRKEHEIFVEMLDRGFVEIQINSWKDVNEAATFIRIIQDKCGMNVYCIEEVAWRRGMISLEQLRILGENSPDVKYKEYIISLCEKAYIK